MRISALSSAADEIVQAFHQKYGDLIDSTDSVRCHMNETVSDWARQLGRQFDTEFPFMDSEEELAVWQARIKHPPIDRTNCADAVEAFAQCCKRAQLPCNRTFWESELNGEPLEINNQGVKPHDDQKISSKLLA